MDSIIMNNSSAKFVFLCILFLLLIFVLTTICGCEYLNYRYRRIRNKPEVNGGDEDHVYGTL